MFRNKPREMKVAAICKQSVILVVQRMQTSWLKMFSHKSLSKAWIIISGCFYIYEKCLQLTTKQLYLRNCF